MKNDDDDDEDDNVDDHDHDEQVDDKKYDDEGNPQVEYRRTDEIVAMTPLDSPVPLETMERLKQR